MLGLFWRRDDDDLAVTVCTPILGLGDDDVMMMI